MKRTIEIIISPQGQVQIDAVGFKGPDCELATRFLEEALGTIGPKTRKLRFFARSRQTCLEWEHGNL